MSMTWGFGRRLMSLTAPSVTASFTYNDSGVRTSKTVGGVKTSYVVAGSNILREARGSDSLDFLYDGSKLIGLKHAGAEYFYVRNGQGDITGIVNGAGTVVVSYSYDAWGNPLGVTGSMASTLGTLNPFRYRGYYFDTETGFYYLLSRYYDPKVGRFLSADEIIPGPGSDIQASNLYSYCFNNPVNMSDDDGHLPFFVVTAVIGAVAGAIIGGVIAASNGGNVLAGMAIGAVAGGVVGAGVGILAGMALAGSVTATTSAVVTGANSLIAAISTGGLAKGAEFLSGNMQKAITGASQVLTNAADRMAAAVEKGRAGERAANLSSSVTRRIPSYSNTAAYRVPDALNDGLISEVKNIEKVLYYTRQINDYVLYAFRNGIPLEIYTNAQLSSTYEPLIRESLVRILPLRFM
jgi:RHS repeat-associated protein